MAHLAPGRIGDLHPAAVAALTSQRPPPPLAPASYGRPVGPAGKIRSTWAVIGLSIITLGIYSLYYSFAVLEEMKQHSGEGVGGVIGPLVWLIKTNGGLNAYWRSMGVA